MENLYRIIAGFELGSEKFRELCWKAWKDEDLKYVCFDTYNIKKEGIFLSLAEAKTISLKVYQKQNLSKITDTNRTSYPGKK